MGMVTDPIRRTCMIVAHPDDETLWAGGLILKHPEWRWNIYSLCRASDPDRSKKFRHTLSEYGAIGSMADLDDGPEQRPLADSEVRQAITTFVDHRRFDLMISHGPRGEYTRHRRHEEVSRAVTALWMQGVIDAGALWLFAYSDGDGAYFPKAETRAHKKTKLDAVLWRKKYRIVTDTYGFLPESWEARAAPETEAFWCFESVPDLTEWLEQEGLTR